MQRPGPNGEEAPAVDLEPVADADRDELFFMFADYWEELDAADPLAPLPYGVAEYRRALLEDLEDRQLVWIRAGGTRAGFAFIRLATDWPDTALIAEISEFYVVPASRRIGVGQAAVREISRSCRASGAIRLEVDVLTGNPGALAFWRACGLADLRRSLFVTL